MTVTACWNCDFWRGMRERGEWGACRRHAPVVVHLPPDQVTEQGDTHASVFPMTMSEERCGDYVPKEQTS